MRYGSTARRMRRLRHRDPQLNRSDFVVGDTVSLEGRDLIAHVGTIVRLPVLLIDL